MKKIDLKNPFKFLKDLRDTLLYQSYIYFNIYKLQVESGLE